MFTLLTNAKSDEIRASSSQDVNLKASAETEKAECEGVSRRQGRTW